MKIEDRTS